MARQGNQENPSVGDTSESSRLQTFAAARVVFEQRDAWGSPPTIRAVAQVLGTSSDTAYKRLLRAVDAGWLQHREGRHGAFHPTNALAELIASGGLAS